MNLKNNIIEVLKTCYDPEIPLDLWSLGLIYEINIENENKSKSDVIIKMSLTTPGCSMGQHMAHDIKEKVSKLDQINVVEVAIRFDPHWKPEMMTDIAKEKLGFYPTPTPSESIENSEWE